MAEHYMVHNTIWMEAFGVSGIEAWTEDYPQGDLCIRCIERRLGRELKVNDFTNVPLNDPSLWNKSSLLISRLVGGTEGE